jgi:hypothetical protein
MTITRKHTEGKPWPEPTVDQPSGDSIEEMLEGTDDTQATDGCYGIEMDGTCEHGHPSWLLYLDMI